jgi:hypothetical protein
MLIPEDYGDGVPLDLDQLKVPTVAIVHLATQQPGSLQQVTLRPDKVSKAKFIRLGETQGDEALCWIHPQNVLVMEILGTVELETGTVTPLEKAA